MAEQRESNSKYYKRLIGKMAPGKSNTRPPRACDGCGRSLLKRHGFPCRRGKAVVCGSCIKEPRYART